jgi:hypothetical protein
VFPTVVGYLGASGAMIFGALGYAVAVLALLAARNPWPGTTLSASDG